MPTDASTGPENRDGSAASSCGETEKYKQDLAEARKAAEAATVTALQVIDRKREIARLPDVRHLEEVAHRLSAASVRLQAFGKSSPLAHAELSLIDAIRRFNEHLELYAKELENHPSLLERMRALSDEAMRRLSDVRESRDPVLRDEAMSATRREFVARFPTGDNTMKADNVDEGTILMGQLPAYSLMHAEAAASQLPEIRVRWRSLVKGLALAFSAVAVIVLFALGGTKVGFVTFVGSSLLAYECLILLRGSEPRSHN